MRWSEVNRYCCKAGRGRLVIRNRNHAFFGPNTCHSGTKGLQTRTLRCLLGSCALVRVCRGALEPGRTRFCLSSSIGILWPNTHATPIAAPKTAPMPAPTTREKKLVPLLPLSLDMSPGKVQPEVTESKESSPGRFRYNMTHCYESKRD